MIIFVFFNAQYTNMNNRILSRTRNFFLIDECPNYLVIRWYHCNSFSRSVRESLSRKMFSWVTEQVVEEEFNVFGQNWSQEHSVIVRLNYIKGEHCWIFCGGHFCWSVNKMKEFSEDLLYHIPQQSLVEIILGLLFPKRHDYRTHQLSAYVDWGQMENLARSCLWLLPSEELMEITAKEKKILKEIRVYVICVT